MSEAQGQEPTPTPGSEPSGQAPPEPEPEAPEQQPADETGRLRKEAANYRRQLREAQAELEQVRLSQASEHERAIAQARREGADEATEVWRTRFHDAAKRNEALRIMSGRVVDPELAMPHMHLDEVEVDEEGHVDSKAIEQKLTALLEAYPVLGAGANGAHPVHHADLGPKSRPAQTVDPNRALREAMMRTPKRR